MALQTHQMVRASDCCHNFVGFLFALCGYELIIAMHRFLPQFLIWVLFFTVRTVEKYFIFAKAFGVLMGNLADNGSRFGWVFRKDGFCAVKI